MSEPLLLTWDGPTWHKENTCGQDKASRDKEVEKRFSKDGEIVGSKIIQACPLQKSLLLLPPPNANTNCNFTAIKITKKNRKYNLIIENIVQQPAFIEVIGGSNKKPAEIECSIKGIAGPCAATHKKKVFAYSERGVKKRSDTELIFNAYSQDLRWQYPWEVEPAKYSVDASTCSRSIHAEIHVYQDLEISVSVAFNRQEEKQTITTTSTNVFGSQRKDGMHKASIVTKETPKESLSWEVKVDGNIKFDGVTVSASGSFKRTVETVNTVLRHIKEIIDKLDEIKAQSEEAALFSQISTKSENKFTFKKPSLEVKVTGKWEELEGSHLCDYEVKVEVNGNPLCSAGLDVDLIGLIASKSPVGLAKDMLARVGADTLQVRFKVDIEAIGGVEVNVYRTAKTEVKGKFQFAIPFELKVILIKFEIEKEILSWKFAIVTEVSVALKGRVAFGFEVTEEALFWKANMDECKIAVVAKCSTDLGMTKKVKQPPPGASEQSILDSGEGEPQLAFDITDKKEWGPIELIPFRKK